MSLTWRKTLGRYLQASNEDNEVVSYFEHFIVPKLAAPAVITWADLGPGPGTKTFGIYELLVTAGIQVKSAEAFDPDPSWRREFIARSREFSRRFPESPELILKDASIQRLVSLAKNPVSNVDSPHNPNFITCIHVLYEIALVSTFCTYIHQRPSCLACIVVEAASSDLWQLRSTLKQKFGIHIPIAAEPAIRKMLFQAKLSYKEDIINHQRCRVSSIRDVKEWFLPFLLGIDYKHPKAPDRNKIIELIRFVEEYIETKRRILSTADIVFVIEK